MPVEHSPNRNRSGHPRNDLAPPPIGRGRGSRSSSPNPTVGRDHFNFNMDRPSDGTGQEEQFQDATGGNIITTASGERIDIDQLRRQAAAAAQQAAQASAALEAATSALRVHKKKPDLPDFDSKNIDIWVKRIEAAYTRAGITSASDKFAYLENKIPVNFNPTIDEYLYGTASDANWTLFIEYLKDEYGLSKQKKASAILDIVKRDGRRPSQHLSRINQLSKDLTMDDLKKETLLRGLPTDIRKIVGPRSKDLTAMETAKLADDYFDKEGRNLESSVVINEVSSPQQNEETTASEPINAVGYQKYTPPFSNSQQRQSRTPNRGFSNFRSKSRGRSSNASNFSSNNTQDLCFYHSSFGAKAKNCEKPCSWKPQPYSQGNGNAGRRM